MQLIELNDVQKKIIDDVYEQIDDELTYKYNITKMAIRQIQKRGRITPSYLRRLEYAFGIDMMLNEDQKIRYDLYVRNQKEVGRRVLRSATKNKKEINNFVADLVNSGVSAKDLKKLIKEGAKHIGDEIECNIDNTLF